MHKPELPTSKDAGEMHGPVGWRQASIPTSMKLDEQEIQYLLKMFERHN